MHLVWPLAALFGSVIWLGVTYRWGRTPQQDGAERAKPPFPVMVLKGVSRCGTGCVLGDIIAEWSALLAPAIAMWPGWGTLFADKMFAVWIADYLVAYVLGITFQYFTIRRCGTCPRHRGCSRRSRRIRCPSPRRSACTARWRWCSSRCSARRSAARHRSIA